MVLLQEHWDGELNEVERAAANAVVDLDAETIICPACTASFPSTPQQAGLRCPECGLNLGG